MPTTAVPVAPAERGPPLDAPDRDANGLRESRGETSGGEGGLRAFVLTAMGLVEAAPLELLRSAAALCEGEACGIGVGVAMFDV